MDNVSTEAFFFNDFSNSYLPQILKEIYIDRVYEPHLRGKKDLTIVDIGANIGLTSYYFKDYAKIVYAVEPAKKHFDCIQKMVEYNKIKNITPVNCAISNTNGLQRFYHNVNTTMYSLNPSVNDKNDFEEINTLKMNIFMKKYNLDNIDFLKLDTEGFEGQIITSDGFQEVKDKIGIIVGEWHTWGSMGREQFASCLRDYGYKFTWYNNTEASVFSAIRE